METRNIPASIELRETNGETEFVISTASVDRHGTVINPNGWELDQFRANPIMAFQHNTSSTDPDDILGTWDIRMETDGQGNTILVGKPNFESADINPKADKIRRKIEAGTLRAVSVGFIPLQYHWGSKRNGEMEDVLYLDRNSLLEVSIVAVPSNPEALKRSVDMLRIELKAELIHQEPEEEMSSETPDEDMGSVELASARSLFFNLKNANA